MLFRVSSPGTCKTGLPGSSDLPFLITQRAAPGALPLLPQLSVMAASSDKCPVDHGAVASSSAEKCPVDHTQRSSWASILGRQPQDGHGAAELPDTPLPPTNLPLDRETSSIPRLDGGNWVYPSQAQFYSAMARKNHNPQETDMRVVVPIHNAVNERAWAEIMKWEAGQGGERCGGVKLVSFKGRPNDRTPRAWFYSLLGYVGVLYWPITLISLVTSLRTDIHHHSIAMTG